MKREHLEHIIRAAGTITNDDDIVVIGSQAVLGLFPNAPAELLVSDEADVFPQSNPRLGELVDSTIGEGSPFQREFGYYAHGVDESSAILPDGWRDRLVLVSGENTRFIRGWCLEIHDLAIAKYAASREKHRDFTSALVRHGMVSRDVLEQRLLSTPVDDEARQRIAARIRADFQQ